MSVYIKKDNKGQKKIDTPTPRELCQQIANIILEHYEVNNILDPCCGDCRLSEPYNCDNIINYEIKNGTDFLQVEHIDEPIDLVIMNPPFNLGTGKKLAVEVFMDKVLELVGKDVPIVLITPMGFRLNQRKKSARWKKLRDEYPPITSILSLPLDCFDKTLFHCEVLFFNLKRLEPHYFIDYI